jgi:hypothetical protein
MQWNNLWLVAVLAIAGLQLSACSKETTASIETKPAKVEPLGETGLHRLTLSGRAAERLGIETATISEAAVTRSESQRKVVPYAALIYDAHGNTWVYTSPEPLKYVRQSITVDYIEGDVAVLQDGPPVGTEVVTVGVPELFGTEFEIGH